VVDEATGEENLLVKTEERNYDDEALLREFVQAYPNESIPDLSRWRRELLAYNRLLKYSFIDSPGQTNSFFTSPITNSKNEPLLDAEGKPRFDTVRMGVDRKFVRRTFSRGSLGYNGRLNGGWWQRTSEAKRTTIRIDDMETIEIDFSGMHPAILYAMKGVTPPEGDYYKLESLFKNVTPQAQRTALKLLVLVAINAKTTKKAFRAFSWSKGGRGIQRSYPHAELQQLLDAFCEKHPLIADSLGADAGITCMRHDSNICMSVINYFTERKTPILSVHDSMIIRITETIPLQERMLVAFHKEFPECRFEPKLVSADTGEDELRHLEPIDRWGQLKHTPETPGYKKRFERFCVWKFPNGINRASYEGT